MKAGVAEGRNKGGQSGARSAWREHWSKEPTGTLKDTLFGWYVRVHSISVH